MWRLVVLFPLFLWMACGAIGAPSSQDLLALLRLDGHPALQGFTATKPAGPVHTYGASAALGQRWFRGPTEIPCEVLLFPTQSAFAEWNRRERMLRCNWTWLDLPEDTRSIRAIPTRKRWEDYPGRMCVQSFHHVIKVNRMLIEVWGFHHPESIRRRPEMARLALLPAELERRVRRIAGTLWERAPKLPANQDGCENGA